MALIDCQSATNNVINTTKANVNSNRRGCSWQLEYGSEHRLGEWHYLELECMSRADYDRDRASKEAEKAPAQSRRER